jgi:hypothetical protein
VKWGIENVSKGVKSYKTQDSNREKKRTATQNEDKLSRDSSVQSGTFASTHKERKRVERNIVTRATTVKEMKRRDAMRQDAEEWNVCKCGVRPILKRRSLNEFSWLKKR